LNSFSDLPCVAHSLVDVSLWKIAQSRLVNPKDVQDLQSKLVAKPKKRLWW
jgi:hypothetical protein